ncbi:MAG TPA: hypothetical protein VFB17_00710 [Gaiellaceae bacterium]|nr:hypothetical protein [Gaiellaceae bacterium]
MSFTRIRRVFVVFAVAASLAVGVSSTSASTSDDGPITASLQALIGSNANAIPEVSSGGIVAYLITITNTTGHTARNVTFTDTLDHGTFVRDDSMHCSGSGSSLTCDVGRLEPGTSFTVRVAFQAPTVSTTVTLDDSLDGTSSLKSHGSNSFSASGEVSVVPASDSLQSTYAFPSSSIDTAPLSATHLQSTGADMPSVLTSGFGTPVSVEDSIPNPPGGCPAPTCIPHPFVISIPDSETTGSSNPFIDPLTNELFPYTWTLELDPSLVPHGVTPQFVYHAPADDPSAYAQLPFCADSPVSLTTPICVDAVFFDHGSGDWVFTGRGIENGNWWGG